jgi:hypothetical protein
MKEMSEIGQRNTIEGAKKLTNGVTKALSITMPCFHRPA